MSDAFKARKLGFRKLLCKRVHSGFSKDLLKTSSRRSHFAGERMSPLLVLLESK